MAEAGFPGIGSLNWNGMFAPARTPKPVVDKLFVRPTIAVMKEPEMQELVREARGADGVERFARGIHTPTCSPRAGAGTKIIKDNNVRID